MAAPLEEGEEVHSEATLLLRLALLPAVSAAGVVAVVPTPEVLQTAALPSVSPTAISPRRVSPQAVAVAAGVLLLLAGPPELGSSKVARPRRQEERTAQTSW